MSPCEMLRMLVYALPYLLIGVLFNNGTWPDDRKAGPGVSYMCRLLLWPAYLVIDGYAELTGRGK